MPRFLTAIEFAICPPAGLMCTGVTHVTREQIRAILARAVGDQSKLKRISLDMNYYLYSDPDGYDGFDQCDPGLLKLAEDKFGRFYYWDTDIEGNSSDDDISEEGDDDNSEEVDDDTSEEGDEDNIVKYVKDVTEVNEYDEEV